MAKFKLFNHPLFSIKPNKMTLLEQNEYLKTENAVLKEMYKLKYWKYP